MKTPAFIFAGILATASLASAIPNPAAEFCVKCGYRYEIRTGPQGGQFGVCVFPDGSECEEWAFYRKCNTPQTCGDCNCPWPCPKRIIYVDDDANGLNNGSSWENAYNYLQDALSDANSSAKPVEIRVAQGIYRPDETSAEPNGTSNREATFQLINGVTIKGGYAGFGEPDPNARDIELYETILSGDLNGDDVDVGDPCDLWNELSRAENSYHVVTGSNTDANAVLDGFTIIEGNANGSSDQHRCGAGLYASYGGPTVTNCVFIHNSAGWGAAAYIEYGSVMVANCVFIENAGGGIASRETHLILTKCYFSCNYASSYYYGGGLANAMGSLRMEKCTFRGNRATAGGGWYNFAYPATATDCTFIENSAGTGAGMGNGGSVLLLNCTFRKNHADWGGGMWNCDTYVMLISCIFEENSGESGGGIYNYEAGSSLTNCTFRKNHANWGGGIHNSGSDATITDCLFSQNTAYESGGGVSNYCSGLTACNCVFSGNSAGNTGGGAFNEAGLQPTLTGCTFTGNSAQKGNALTCPPLLWYQGIVRLANCILWDGGDEIWNNESSTIMIAYSDVQGGWPGKGNIDLDPCFATLSYRDSNGVWIDGDYHLKSQAGRWDANSASWVKDDVTSPCIDAGDTASPIGLEPFPNGGIINMGAYGGTAEASKSYFGEPVCETIVAGDINGDCIINFKDFAIMAFHWLEEH